MLLGDMIAKVTSALGIRPCEPCKRRQAALNAWHARVVRVELPRASNSATDSRVNSRTSGK